MRTLLMLLMLGLAMPPATAALAAEAGALEQALAEEAGLSPQAPFTGVTDAVWQAYHVSPAAGLALVAHCPQGFGEKPDAVLAAAAKEPFKELLVAFLSYADESDADTLAETSRALALGQPVPERELSGSWYANTVYEVFRPSARYVSVLFNHHEYTGGAHGNSTYRAFSFDLHTGRTLALADLFVDEKAALDALVPRIADGVQAQKEPDAPPVDRDPSAVDLSMDRVALTPDGLRVVYAPYEMGSYSEGEFIVDIAKANLIAMGARPELWQ